MFEHANKTFKNAIKPLIVTGLALGMAFTPSAMAGKDFYKKDLSNETTEVAQIVGQRLSHDTLTFVVHGGEKSQQMAVYRAAQRLDDEGIAVALLLAPDDDGLKGTIHVEYYTKGGTQYYSIYGENIDKAEIEQGIYEHAKTAYEKDFPESLALRHQ